jgi:hypothetical protein
MGSYFDHDSPNFLRDGLVVTATGLQASADGVHQAWDFPAYWSASLRQYVYYDGHNGYDFNLWYEPVYAAAPGRVIFAGWEYPDAHDHGYGDMVMIDHRNGYVTLYGHFSRLRVKAGQRVRRLQPLGVSGNSGHSSGPHLHFTVFHNCSPTDPYGWTGSGPDPLEGYQNESSIYLWLRAPLVINPLPKMPGLGELPPTSLPRLLLLKLPSTAHGTHTFVLDLLREARDVRAALGDRGVRLDLLYGAVDVKAKVSAQRLYQLPFVASIASMDGASDAKADVLSALARAALIDRRRGLPLGRSHGWTGYLLQWQGRTFLVGTGPKSKRAALRLNRPRGSTIVEKLQADPETGAYAIDLGKMSRRDVALLDKQLQGGRQHSTVSVRPEKRTALIRPVSGHTDSRFEESILTALVTLGLLGISGGLGWVVWSSRRHSEN